MLKHEIKLLESRVPRKKNPEKMFFSFANTVATIDFAKKYKGYKWDQNYGYGTKHHLKAIKDLGITSHHRKKFSPINKIK